MMALVQSNHLRFHTIQEILRQLWMQCNFSIRKDFEVYQEAHGMGVEQIPKPAEAKQLSI